VFSGAYTASSQAQQQAAKLRPKYPGAFAARVAP
jgi:hypothetical protein